MGVVLSILKRLLQTLVAALVFVLLGGGGFYIYLNYDGNFHPIREGVAYRSAQLDAQALAGHIASENIKTIVNLRGANPSKEWYSNEARIAKQSGVTLIDIPLSSSEFIKPAEARAYVDLINNAPKPVLIHCLNGSDRTGFISAVYLMQNGVDEITAGRELSLRYGHFPHGPWVATKAMDQSLNAFIQTLQPGTD